MVFIGEEQLIILMIKSVGYFYKIIFNKTLATYKEDELLAIGILKITIIIYNILI